MSKPAIIIIDDEKAVLNSVLNQLKSAFGFNYTYEIAETVQDAWEVLEELKEEGVEVKLLISDWLMPKVKGDQFLIEVAEKYPDISQIMLSGYADQDSIDNAWKNANLKAFIKKPWEEKELIAEVDKVMQGS